MLDKLIQLKSDYTADDAAWDAFVARHPHGSLLQMTNWATLKGRFGWSSRRVWLRQDGELAAGAQILFRTAAWGTVKVAYIPHGPLVDWTDEEQVTLLFNQIDFALYEHRAGFLSFEPLVWQGELPQWEAICQRLGNVPSDVTVQPPQTIILDLRPSTDEILAAMKQKTRYNIRLAARKGVTVRQGTLADMPIFNALMRLTGQRDGFGVHAPEYYQAAYELFSPDRVALFVAEYEARPLAAIMVFRWGQTAAYLYGASGNEQRELMPNYAVQWAAIEWAKAQGCTCYDLWGIPDAPEDELESNFTERTDGLWGVYRFKRGFGGQMRRTVGAWERPNNKLVQKLYHWWRRR
jgi:lipid II:glycine glycyltransferase (peptidoglycan interpeptide bridge formation enzyme)